MMIKRPGWRIAFKNLLHAPADEKNFYDEDGYNIGIIRYIYIALLHKGKTGKMLWLNESLPIFCPELAVFSIITGHRFWFPFYMWKSNVDCFKIESLLISEIDPFKSITAHMVFK